MYQGNYNNIFRCFLTKHLITEGQKVRSTIVLLHGIFNFAEQHINTALQGEKISALLDYLGSKYLQSRSQTNS